MCASIPGASCTTAWLSGAAGLCHAARMAAPSAAAWPGDSSAATQGLPWGHTPAATAYAIARPSTCDQGRPGWSMPWDTGDTNKARARCSSAAQA